MLRWIPDHDDAESVDDLVAKNVTVRLERMDSGHYWLCIYADGEEHHFDLTSKRKITAFARQPAPRRRPKQPTSQTRENAALILSAAAGSDGFRIDYGVIQIAYSLGFDDEASKLALSALDAHASREADAEAALRTGEFPGKDGR